MEKSNGYQECQLLAIASTPPTIRTFANYSQTLTFSESERWGIKIGDCSSLSCHNGLAAIIDQKNDLWLLDRSLAGPLNISELVRLKARRVFMGEGQLIFESKRRGWILINWSGKIDLDSTKLSKLHIAHNIWSNAIDAYFLDEECEESSLWYFSSIKKLENTVKVYLLHPTNQQILGFAGRKSIKLKEKPSGMHLGKYHGLCWTVSGKLFSWGCKNLGMGLRHYQKSYYEDAQQINIKQSVFKAVAGINYSLALTSNGNLYEWGISYEGEPILTPRPLKMKQNKFVDLKAFDNFFVGLTSSNEILFWGKGKERYMPEGCKQVFEGVFSLPKTKEMKIYDYYVEQNYLLVLISKDSGNISRQEKQYFTQVLRKASQKFLPHRIKRQNSPFSSLRPQPNDQQVSFQLRRNEDYIDRLINTQVNKQEYFTMVQNQQAVFRRIMQENSSRSISRVDSFISSKENIPHETSKFSKTRILKCHRKIESARQTPNIALSIESSNRMIRQFQHQQAQRRSKKKRCKMPSPPKRQKTDYGSRLEAVLLKKQEIQQTKRQERLQVLRKKDQMARKVLHQNQEQSILEAKKIFSKFSKWFARASACSLLLSPLELGRQLKIMQLTLAPPCDVITQNMKNMLLNSRAVSLIKSLQHVQPRKYDILAKVIVRGVQRWRAKKDKRYRADIVRQIIKFSLKAKTRFALTPVWLATRKLQKVCKWISIQQKERSMQLKMVWKKALLLYLRPTPSFQNKKPSICKEQLNYKLCSEKIRNPRLNHFLLASPIFKLKLLFPHPIEVVEDNHYESFELETLTQSSQILHFKKGVSWAENQVISRKMINGKEQRKSLSSSSGPTDILLYSQHYDCFYKPKNYQINIPDSMKLSDKWIAEERRILNRIIKEILLQQWKQFCSDRAVYELRLAHFIKENYQTLVEQRWKFLIEYNKIKNEQGGVAKRQRELWTLLRSIGADSLLASDVMPQKHKIIQYAKQLKGSPIPPSLEVVLPNQQFKKQFKTYYEGVSNRAKYLRKFYN